MTYLALLLHRVTLVPVVTACAALFALMVLTFCDVLLRSMLNAPIEAATELTRILMAVLVFSVLPVISVTNGHVAVDLADGIFRRLRLERLRDGLLLILCGGMMIWPVRKTWQLAERTRDYGDVTEYLAIPVYLIGWFIACAVAVSAAAMVLSGLLRLFAPSKLAEFIR